MNSILSIKVLSKFLLAFLVLMIGGPVTKVFAETIVLKMEIPHLRNLNHISLTFKENTVEFVTNAFQISSQNKTPQLGQFETPMTSELRSFKGMLRSHYRTLTNMIQIPGIIAHAPILHLNGQRVYYNYPYFSYLESIINRVIEREWTCVHCAEYRKDGGSILRIVKNRGQREQRRRFSTRALDCRRLNQYQEYLECVDPQFGIFEIIM